jgi:hypothetical protein
MRHSNNVASPRLQGSRLCQTCGEKLPATKRSGRHRLFCSDRCRDVRRRNLNFDFYGSTAQGQAKPRNAKNPPTISKNCKADSAGRGRSVSWQRIVEIDAAGKFVCGN